MHPSGPIQDFADGVRELADRGGDDHEVGLGDRIDDARPRLDGATLGGHGEELGVRVPSRDRPDAGAAAASAAEVPIRPVPTTARCRALTALIARA